VPTSDEIRRITELRDQGYSLEEIGEKLKKDKSTISRWFKSLGVDCNSLLQRCTTKKAAEATTIFSRNRRLALNDKLFGKLEGYIDEDDISARDFKDYLISYGILEDKRTLLEPFVPELAKTKLDTLIEILENDCIPTAPAATDPSIPGLPQDPANPDVRLGEERED